VTHECFDPRELSRNYPRGEKSLIGPFHRFGAADTVDWFAGRGVTLKTEADGRMFPDTDNSQTIVDALLDAAHAGGVSIHTSEGVVSIVEHDDDFEVVTDTGNTYTAANVLLATGGTRLAAGAKLAARLGHELRPPTPSLFTFKIKDPRLVGLLGLSVSPTEVSIQQSKLESSGPLLITHWGLSGPGILKISAWGARELAERDYRFDIAVNWLPDVDPAAVVAEKRRSEAKRQLSSRSPFATIPKRLWLRLLAAADISESTPWSQLGKQQASRLVTQLTASTFTVTGKSTNKDEFVTCGGVSLEEINFKTMESKLVPGLYFAGEVIDVDGITGGFNFQNAWTNGFHAGSAIAAS
jgi:predicted Rossmann fold flavoprotein